MNEENSRGSRWRGRGKAESSESGVSRRSRGARLQLSPFRRDKLRAGSTPSRMRTEEMGKGEERKSGPLFVGNLLATSALEDVIKDKEYGKVLHGAVLMKITRLDG